MSGALSQDNVNEWENEWRAVSRQCVYPVSSVSYRGRRRRARARALGTQVVTAR